MNFLGNVRQEEKNIYEVEQSHSVESLIHSTESVLSAKLTRSSRYPIRPSGFLGNDWADQTSNFESSQTKYTYNPKFRHLHLRNPVKFNFR